MKLNDFCTYFNPNQDVFDNLIKAFVALTSPNWDVRSVSWRPLVVIVIIMKAKEKVR